MNPIWTPTHAYINQSNLKKYENWLFEKKGLSFSSYSELWQWSIENISDFWESCADFFEINFHQKSITIFTPSESAPYNGKWFDGATLNYAEHIFRNKTSTRPAIIFQSENTDLIEISWEKLEKNVTNLQQFLIEKGVKKGDRIAGYLTNSPEAIVAFLAANSIGAIWSCCSPDFGFDSILDRFQQIEPKILFANSGYYYGGKFFDKNQIISDLSNQISSIEQTIIVDSEQWNEIISKHNNSELTFTSVEFSHPIWILYSSGTTGKPKAITHGTGGNLIEHLKALSFHQNVSEGDRFFWYTTTGWMMWNYAHSSLLVGATLCIYDGSPAMPNLNILWDFAENAKVNHFGGGAAFYISCMKSAQKFNQIDFKTIGSTGSPLPPEAFRWIYDTISKDVHLISLSGGTDVCSAFLSGNPYLPIYEGEIQCRTLGSAVEAWNDEGKAVENEVGELIITQPMPSMPVFFWNDAENQKYKSSYYEKCEGVWCHGDWIKINERGGITIFGRSDATLNRDGVRIGTAEIYNAVDSIQEIKDSLVVCVEKSDGSAYMPLFVVVADNQILTDELQTKIKKELRVQYSPRHVPDSIVAVPEIPYTISGKKMEMPIKKILMGVSLEKAVSLDAMKNPDSIRFFVELAED